MDVHKDTVSIAVMNCAGKVLMESVLETKAASILQFIPGLRRNLLVTLEEGTWAAWLYDLLKPYVTQVTVCNPRKNALLRSGNKGDRIDAQKLAELLRHGSLSAVYHGEEGLRTLRELSRSYLTITKDLTRVMNRLKALYHSWGIACSDYKGICAGSVRLIASELSPETMSLFFTFMVMRTKSSPSSKTRLSSLVGIKPWGVRRMSRLSAAKDTRKCRSLFSRNGCSISCSNS